MRPLASRTSGNGCFSKGLEVPALCFSWLEWGPVHLSDGVSVRPEESDEPESPAQASPELSEVQGCSAFVFNLP